MCIDSTLNLLSGEFYIFPSNILCGPLMLRIIVYIYIIIFLRCTMYTPCVNLTVDSLFIAVDADWFAFSRCEKGMIE